MAEALMEENLSSPETKFFCHKCSVEIPRVLPDYTCPTCNSGFIEEMEPSQAEDDNDADSGDESFNGVPAHDFVSMMVGELVGTPAHRRSDDGGGRFTRSQAQRQMTHVPLETLIQDFIVNFTGMDLAQLGALEGGRRMAPVSFFLGNPGDYAWGREGLDAIITQLLNQMDGTGPPPLAKEKIQSIPSVPIAKEQTDQNLQCSVCWEDFTLGEHVRKLPCEHFYHDKCIIPWLELHGTCPICRKVLHEEGSDEQNRGGASAASAHTSTLPQSLAALFRVASGAGSGREGSHTSQDSSSSGSSGSSSSTTSTSTHGSSSASTTSAPATATRPNTRSQQQQQQQQQRSNPPRNPPHFWDDLDMDFD